MRSSRSYIIKMQTLEMRTLNIISNRLEVKLPDLEKNQGKLYLTSPAHLYLKLPGEEMSRRPFRLGGL